MAQSLIFFLQEVWHLSPFFATFYCNRYLRLDKCRTCNRDFNAWALYYCYIPVLQLLLTFTNFDHMGLIFLSDVLVQTAIIILFIFKKSVLTLQPTTPNVEIISILCSSKQSFNILVLNTLQMLSWNSLELCCLILQIFSLHWPFSKNISLVTTDLFFFVKAVLARSPKLASGLLCSLFSFFLTSH